MRKSWLQKANWVLVSIGIDLKRIRNIKYIPRFLKDVWQFKKSDGQIDGYFPCISDYHESAGDAKGHYFHQDIIVAQYIYNAKPNRHLDVGSRIAGFVAHVSVFREIEVVDVRDLSINGHSNIIFKKLDMCESVSDIDKYDSVSCLHAIEHFGLGRYGDQIDPDGYKKGFENLIKILQPGGLLYISFPIANSNRVDFNAHRVFKANDILKWTDDWESLRLVNFDYINDNDELIRNASINGNQLSNINYGCGIYTIQKIC